MASFEFLVPQREHLPSSAVERAYFCGIDETPWPSQISNTKRGIIVQRPDRDSGCLHIPWIVPGHGELMLSTGTLMPRAQPYHLPVELARGTLHRLRMQAWVWEAAGLTTSDELRDVQRLALRHFAQSAARQHDPAEGDREAQAAIELVARASELLVDLYSQQAIQARRHAGRAVPLLGCGLGQAVPDGRAATRFKSRFNTAVVPFQWANAESVEGKKNWQLSDAQVSWAQAQGLRICGGPLVDLQGPAIPDWVYLWEGDFDNLLLLASDHVTAVVKRFKGRVHLWNCAGLINSGTALSLTEEQRLRLAVKTIEIVRSLDSRTPLFISFDQPWGEYLPRRRMELSPLAFADTLLRADLGLAALGIELDLSAAPEGTARRSALELSRLIDRWSQLGVPLLITLTSADATDEEAQLLQSYVPLLLSKHPVQAVFWKQFQDIAGTKLKRNGLLDEQGHGKVLYRALKAIQKAYLAR